jgi:N-acetylneuraminic acid mutarotase
MKLQLVIFILVILFSCKEEEVIVATPRTNSPTEISISSVVLNGELVVQGNQPIDDHGFVWSETTGISSTNGTVISLGTANNIELFTAPLTGLSRAKNYHYVAFVTVNGKKIFGTEVVFTTGTHTVNSIAPASLNAGEKFAIVGSNFGTNPLAVFISIGTLRATVNSVTETSIEATLPSTITAGNKSLKVTIDGSEVSAQSGITVTPKIESISSAWGFSGDEIEITGSGFGSLNETMVKFNDKNVTVISSTNSKIMLSVPYNSPGTNSVKVVTNSITSSNATIFKILAWKKLTELPITARHSASSFLINDFLYLGLGSSISNTRFNDFWKVNVHSGEVTQLNNFPQGARFATQFFTIEQKGYIVLGYDETTAPVTELWEYDVSTDLWSQKASFPGGTRSGAVSFVLNGVAYVGCGIANGVTSLKDMYSYDPATNQWTQEADFGGDPIYGQGSFVIQGKAYVAGGTKNNDTRVNEVWEFSGTTWTRRADYPGLPITDGIGFNFSNFGCLGFGSIDNSNAGIQNFIYKPETNSWNQWENFPGSGRTSVISGVSDKYWYFGLGFREIEYRDIWIVELP